MQLKITVKKYSPHSWSLFEQDEASWKLIVKKWSGMFFLFELFLLLIIFLNFLFLICSLKRLLSILSSFHNEFFQQKKSLASIHV